MKTILAAALALALLAPAAAHDCTFAMPVPEVDAAGFYVDNDVCQFDGCVASIWVYQESNGIEGLQRGDVMIDDTCGGAIEPDTIVASVFA